VIRLPLSPSASGLFRALLARTGVSQNRILLIEFSSLDWQSLTFTGERHHICLRVQGSDPGPIVHSLINGLEDAEFHVPGQIVADIALVGVPCADEDGSITVEIEALTIAE
jgi:hypothetical protein